MKCWLAASNCIVWKREDNNTNSLCRCDPPLRRLISTGLAPFRGRRRTENFSNSAIGSYSARGAEPWKPTLPASFALRPAAISPENICAEIIAKGSENFSPNLSYSASKNADQPHFLTRDSDRPAINPDCSKRSAIIRCNARFAASRAARSMRTSPILRSEKSLR